MKIKTKEIVCGVLITALAAANAYNFKRANDLRGRVENTEKKVESVESKAAAQAEKNARYENAIGFFKFAVSIMNLSSSFRYGMIDFYTGDTVLYDINGKFPEDYYAARERGEASAGPFVKYQRLP